MGDIVREILLLGISAVLLAHTGEGAWRNNGNQNKLVIEHVVGKFQHGEGPHWDHRSQKLYFVDIIAQKICRFDPVTKDLSSIYLENGPVAVVIPVEGEPNKLVAGAATNFVLVNWDANTNVTKSVAETLAVVDTDREGTRWNDGKADSSGRFWGGTMGPEVNLLDTPNRASLYRIDSDLKPKKMLSPVSTSNGLAWNLEDDTLYYIDTPTRKIAAFDFDSVKGVISNKRIVFDLEKNNITGVPDGMTMDRDGNLWIALYTGSGVLNVDPRTGHVIRFIELPAKYVTSVAFGGPLLDILYVTTSSHGLTPQEEAEQPHAGYVFAVHGLGVHGLIANLFKY